MADGYTRQSAANIVTGNTIQASDLNNEFNAIQSFADATLGHTHDGTIGGGATIPLGTAVSGQLSVANGGTGASTLTQFGLLVGNGTAAIAALAVPANGTILTGVSGANPAFSAAPVLGVNATTTGTLGLANGNALGVTVTLQNISATTAYNWNLPATVGTSGQVLTSAAGGTNPMTWTTLAASATTDTTNASNISSGTLSLSRLALANGDIYVGNASANPAAVAMSGDVTITNAGVATVGQINGVALGSTTATSGNLLVGQGTNWVTKAVSGDATLAATGALTVTKTNGVAFATSATTDTTNASNISSGTLAAARGGAGTVNGIMKANGSGLVSAAVSATDYAPATSGSAILSGNGAGGFSNVTIGSCLTFAGGTLSFSGAAAAGVPSGTVVPFSGITNGFGNAIPSGWLLCDGQAVSRTTFSALFNIVCPSTTFTVTIASPAVFTITAHGLKNGDALAFETSGTLPTGLTADTTYYVISAGLTANAFEVSTSRNGSAVNTSGTQSGTQTAFRNPYGTLTSTNFTVPDLRGRSAFGMDNMGGTAANRIAGTSGIFSQAIGGCGGSEMITLTTSQIPSHQHTAPSHTHSGSSLSSSFALHCTISGCTVVIGGAPGSSFGASSSTYNPTISGNTGAGGGCLTSATGCGGAHINMPPTLILNYIIKT